MPKTIEILLKDAKTKLSKKGVPTAHLDVEILLSYVVKKQKEFLYAHPEYKLSRSDEKKFSELLARRMNREPIAYITGEKEFYGYTFLVNSDVLIPRPITELLVDKALALIDRWYAKDPLHVIDVGTGSGNVILSIVHEVKKKYSDFSKYVSFFAIDISQKALNIARLNAKRYKVDKDIAFLHGDLLKPVAHLLTKKGKMIIAANLPYIPYHQKKTLPPEIRRFEPDEALFIERPNQNFLYVALNNEIQNVTNARKTCVHAFYECPWEPESITYTRFCFKKRCLCGLRQHESMLCQA